MVKHFLPVREISMVVLERCFPQYYHGANISLMVCCLPECAVRIVERRSCRQLPPDTTPVDLHLRDGNFSSFPSSRSIAVPRLPNTGKMTIFADFLATTVGF